MKHVLLDIFRRMSHHFGPLSWWPAETPFEVCVGAILTQNTAWTNVEKAIAALKTAGAMTPAAIHTIDAEQLALLIRPAGCYNLKCTRLKHFVDWLFRKHGGSLEYTLSGELDTVRSELLAIKGIGPETADSILLYAGNRPTFVVDGYTRRLYYRLGLLPEKIGYDETRRLFMGNLPHDTCLFNEYHALIVEQCKRHCRTRPLCSGCPLLEICPFMRQSTGPDVTATISDTLPSRCSEKNST